MRKKYIDYYAIQCDILKKLDDPKNRCMIINYGIGGFLFPVRVCETEVTYDKE